MSLDELQRLESQHVIGTYARLPVEFVRGEGSWLWDEEGNEYLDLLCGISVTNLGHCHPRVVEAVRQQAGTLIHVSNLFYTEPAMRLAARLTESSLGGKVFFCNSGAEAIEAAVKLSRRAKAGGGVVTLAGGFHGRTYAALSLTTSNVNYRTGHGPLLPDVHIAPFPNVYRDFAGDEERAVRVCLAHLERLFATELPPSQVAAFIIEPVQGEGGFVPAPPAFLQGLRALADRHGILLVV
ncbi:MAG: aspartate aminotransferase family protein, partial [Solirubrobacterales bacterium]